MACSSGGGAKVWDQGRIANTGTDWWVNVRQGAYYFSFDITPSYQDDKVGRADVVSFAQAVVAKIKGSPTPAQLVPASNEISGWAYDPGSARTANGPGLASDGASAESLIDGGAAAFFDGTKSYQATGLAWEVYAKDTYKLDLQVWQMKNAAEATLLYKDLLSSSSLYSNATFKACPGTDAANPCGACSGTDPANPCGAH
jgi:hypothetical protein